MSDDIFGADFLDDIKAMETEDTRSVTARVADDVKDGTEVPVHPAAELFPMMQDTDDDGWEKFVSDVSQHGCLQPIVVDSTGRIVDGRNRYAAIKQILAEGGPLPTFRVELCPVVGDGRIREWVISTNLHRRHLTTSQRAAIAAEMVTATKASGATSRTKHVEHVTVADAAAAMNVSERQVKKASQVKKAAEAAGKPEVVKAVKEGKTTVNAAATALKPPTEKKGKAAPAKKSDPTPVAMASQKALTEEQLAGVRKIIAHASLAQLNMLKGAITGQIRMLEKSTKETTDE